MKAAKIRELEEQKAHVNCRTEQRIYVAISPMSFHHAHQFGEMAGFSQTVNKAVSARIQDLVCEGVTSVQEVKKCLDYYVQDVLFGGKNKPSRSCRAFFPTQEDIHNHIQAALRRDRFSSFDQENAKQLIDKYQREEPDSKFFYRQYQKKTEQINSLPSDDVLEQMEQKCEETLLFCYQSKFMNEMLIKYGQSVSCLDATNKTTDYALPLFFIVVKTAQGYMCADVFITQFETSACVAEALEVFRQWCPDFNPQYWMIDYSQVEINALQSSFPQSQITICDFHREQAWGRWLNRSENCTVAKEDVLFLLRRIANATSEEEMNHCINDLKASRHWENEKFRCYIDTHWLRVKEMWVRAYRLGYDVVLTTNNGTEAQNKILKQYYIKNSHGRKSLAMLISTLVKQFLPDRQHQHQRKVMSLSSSYRTYKNNIPEYLHNRPPAFIKLVMQRMFTACEYTHEDIKRKSAVGQYLVQSQSSSSWHTVDFAGPNCTCMDFAATKFPCKHFCAVFRLTESSFSDLPESYLNRPHVAVTACATADDQENEPDSQEGHGGGASSHEVTALSIPLCSSNQLKMKRNNFRSIMEKCGSLLFYCSDSSALDKAAEKLEEAYSLLAQSVPSTSGLFIRNSPTKGCSGQASHASQKDAVRAAPKILQTERTNKEHWRTRGRVGKQADELRKTINVNPLE
ncbi:uncharacterized protein LOC144124556 [Amblyomma americanum]